MSVARALAYTCFFLSGASTLVYEVVWMRQMQLTLGSTTAAVSTVLAAFMAGLAIGAAAFGRLADRLRNPLRLYAGLEAAIGAYAILVPSLLEVGTPVYVGIARALTESPVTLAAVRLGLALLLLAPPTVMMGGTFPVLLQVVKSGGGRFGSRLGLLYGCNVAGAVAGSSLAGFWLIRSLGLGGATAVAVLCNFCIALVATVIRLEPTDEPPPSAAPLVSPPAAARRVIWVVCFLSGLATMALEVLWTRVLVFSFSSTVYAFTIILATFLLGLALGSWLFAVLEGRVERTELLTWSLVAAGTSTLLLAPVSPRVYELTGLLSRRWGHSGAIHLTSMALACALMLLLPAICMGIVFPLASRLLAPDPALAGRRIGTAYLVNTLGSVAGSLVTGFAIIPALGLKGAFLLVGLLEIAAGWALVVVARTGPRALGRALPVGALALAVLWHRTFLPGASPFDPQGRHPKGKPEALLAHVDGSTASVSVLAYGGGDRSLRIDGFEAAADDRGRYGYMKLMTHIPALLHRDPRRLLVISFGTGTTAGAGLLHPGLQVDAIDINRAVFDLAHHFEEANRGVARNPRARLVVDDGRNYVLVSSDRYDIITSEPMPPTFAGIVNLYSREYYQLARARLAPGGILVQWLPFHLLTASESWDILATVRDVFPATTLWVHGRTGIVVAPLDGELSVDPDRVRRALAQPDLALDLAEVGIRSLSDLTDLFALAPASVARLTADASVITDDLPSLEFHPPRPVASALRGTFQKDEATVLGLVHLLRRSESLPVLHAGPSELEVLERSRHRAACIDLAAIATAIGALDMARAQLEEAAAHCDSPEERARLLDRAARVPAQGATGG